MAMQIAVAVVVHDGRVLVGRRSAAAANAPGLNEFPGGKVEPGETPEAAAARECLEEAGVPIRVGMRLDAVQTVASSGPINVIFFTATPADPEAAVAAPFEWLPIAHLTTRAFPAANGGVLAWLQSRRAVYGGS